VTLTYGRVGATLEPLAGLVFQRGYSEQPWPLLATAGIRARR
jgi:hypothetical protein